MQSAQEKKHSKGEVVDKMLTINILRRAVIVGDLTRVEKSLPAIRGDQSQEETLLFLALEAPNVDIFHLLLSKYKTLYKQLGDKLVECIALHCQHWTEEERKVALQTLKKRGFHLHHFHQAIVDNNYSDADLTKEFLTKPDSQNNIAIHYASALYRPPFLEKLKEYKDFLDLVKNVNNNTWSPLLFAALNSHTEAVIWLVENGKANILKSNNQGNIAFLLAASRGHLGTLKYLWEKRKDQTAHQNNEGETALHLAAAGNHFDSVRWLIETAKTEIHVANQKGETPLLYAIYKGHLQVAKYLLFKGGANIAQPSNQGNHMLCYAIESGDVKMLEWVISEVGGTQTTTPAQAREMLLYAAACGYDHLVTWLINEYWFDPGDGMEVTKYLGLDGKKQIEKAKEFKDLFNNRYVNLLKNWDSQLEMSGVSLIDSPAINKKLSSEEAENQILQWNTTLLKDLKDYSEPTTTKWKDLATKLYTEITSQIRYEPSTIHKVVINFFAHHPEISEDTQLHAILKKIISDTIQFVAKQNFIERERKNSKNSRRNSTQVNEASPRFFSAFRKKSIETADSSPISSSSLAKNSPSNKVALGSSIAEGSPGESKRSSTNSRRFSFSALRRKSTDTRENPLIPKSSSNSHVASDLLPAGGSTSDNKQSGPSSRFSFSFSRKKSTEKAEGSNAVPSSQSLGRKDSGATVQDIPPAVSNTTGDNRSPD